MNRHQFVAWIVVVVIAMVAWTVVTLGFWALLMDPACGGPVCNRMRQDSANLRTMLLVAWVAGGLLGGAILAGLIVRLRRLGHSSGRA